MWVRREVDQIAAAATAAITARPTGIDGVGGSWRAS
jgi:hypothetical protein